MNKEEVIEAFCGLATHVMCEEFNFSISADCFCKSKVTLDGKPYPYFCFDKKIFEFIEDAVNEKLDQKHKEVITSKINNDTVKVVISGSNSSLVQIVAENVLQTLK